jgi:hypothetical protein
MDAATSGVILYDFWVPNLSVSQFAKLVLMLCFLYPDELLVYFEQLL